MALQVWMGLVGDRGGQQGATATCRKQKLTASFNTLQLAAAQGQTCSHNPGSAMPPNRFLGVTGEGLNPANPPNCCVPRCMCAVLGPCRKVSLEGVPEDPLWPTADQLLQLLATRLGAAVHTKVTW